MEKVKSNNFKFESNSHVNKFAIEKDFLKGQKIFIVMLWSKNLSEDENEYIHKDYLIKNHPKNNCCLKECLDYYGIILDIVENYRDAIEKITSKNEFGKCPYYAIWVINGPPYEVLPDGTKEAYLLGQFLEAIKLFWEKGGALVFLAGGGKLQYQTNEFLKLLDFDGKKIQFFLVGNDEDLGTKEHKGGKYLKPDFTGLLKDKQRFCAGEKYFNDLKRLNLSDKLDTLFEGKNLCYANTDDYEKLKPFRPFSRDSENGISSLFFLSDEKGRGDIFIDCGFTKLFLNMEKDNSVYRYFQNIAAWTARMELHLKYDFIHARDWRPENIEYKIDINKRWTKFEIDLFKLKTLFALDNSGSITGNELYFNEVKRLLEIYNKPGDKIYLWGSTYTKQSKSQIYHWINNKHGSEGTYIINIAKIAKGNPEHREHLIIVTDGCVSANDIAECDKFLEDENIKFKFVSVYLIGRQGDKSVGAPFCRNCPNQQILVLDYNNRNRISSLSMEDIKKLRSLFQ